MTWSLLWVLFLIQSPRILPGSLSFCSLPETLCSVSCPLVQGWRPASATSPFMGQGRPHVTYTWSMQLHTGDTFRYLNIEVIFCLATLYPLTSKMRPWLTSESHSTRELVSFLSYQHRTPTFGRRYPHLLNVKCVLLCTKARQRTIQILTCGVLPLSVAKKEANFSTHPLSFCLGILI